jgi:hypothetical protein
LLSWVEKVQGRERALRFSRLGSTGWSAPMTVAQGSNWFNNWAEMPAVTPLSKGRLAAHWFVRNSQNVYGYDVRLSQSEDNGHTWSKPVTPHVDGTSTQHGFTSIVPWTDDHLVAVWLDGRQGAVSGREDDISLRYALLDRSGQIGASGELDHRVCSCCATAAARTESGVLVGYRDRSPEEVRDIAVVRLEDERSSESLNVAEDGWVIPACPVNGPALASQGKLAAIAWFHAADEAPTVQVAFSADGGRTFGKAFVLDQSVPRGYVDVAVLPDGSAAAVWLGKGAKALFLQRIWPDGRRDDRLTVTSPSGRRIFAFPKVVYHNGDLYVTWRVAGRGGDVRLARVQLDQIDD